MNDCRILNMNVMLGQIKKEHKPLLQKLAKCKILKNCFTLKSDQPATYQLVTTAWALIALKPTVHFLK